MTERNATCLVCGKPLDRTPGPGRPRLYCSPRCRSRSYVERLHGFNLHSIAEVHGTTCYLCRQPIDMSTPRGNRAPCTDHIIPVSLGGRNDMSNLRVVHVGCNLRKGVNLHCPDCGASLGTRMLAGGTL